MTRRDMEAATSKAVEALKTNGLIIPMGDELWCGQCLKSYMECPESCSTRRRLLQAARGETSAC